MALKKNAHQLFTDREEPRQAFWNTLRKLEEEPGSSKVITYYGEGGIGKTWLINDLKRRVDHMDPLSDESGIFSDDFVFRGEYVPIVYNLETSTDMIEILCQLRYSLYLAKEELAFPLFDCAVKKYKEITGKNLSVGESGSESVLARYESIIDTAAMFIPQLGPLQTVYSYVKKGGNLLKSFMSKIEDKRLRDLYSEYFEAIYTSETADDIQDNIAEFFKTDLNVSERDFAVVFFIDTYELLTYKTGIKTHSWLSEELAKETVNTLWVFSGRNRIYDDYENEHLLGNLSEKDTVYYLREKIGITDEKVIERIYEISNGTPIFLDICVQNYRSEGNPSAEEFKNLNKEQLLKRYVKYLSDGERLIIRLMSSMSHWTDQDYKEVFNAVHNGSFSQYHEAYNKVLRSTMIEKDNDDRYFLHRAVRTGIYEDPDYPSEIRTASRDAILKLYDKRAHFAENTIYYAGRIIELTRQIAEENQELSEIQLYDLSYTLINITAILSAFGRKKTAWFYENLKNHIRSFAHTENGKAYIGLFTSYISVLLDDFQSALDEALWCRSRLAELYGEGSRSTLLAARTTAIACLNTGNYERAAEILETVLEKFKENYPDEDPDLAIVTVGIPQILAAVYRILNDPDKTEIYALRVLESDIQKFGEEDPRTILSRANYAACLYQIGRNEDALREGTLAYESSVHNFGEYHEQTLNNLNNLIHYYIINNQLDQAAAAAEKCVENTRTGYGEDSRLYALAEANLGFVLICQGKYADAQMILEKCISFLQSIPNGMNTPLYRNPVSYLAQVYSAQGRYAEAFEKFKECYEISKRMIGENNPETQIYKSMMGECMYKVGENEAALDPLKESWVCLKYLVGEFHNTAVRAAERLAAYYKKNDIRNADAAEVYRSLENYYKSINKDSKKYSEYMMKRLSAESLSYDDYQKKVRKPLGELKKAYQQIEEQLGENHRDVFEAKMTYVTEAYALKAYSQADQCAINSYNAAKNALGEKDPLTLQFLHVDMMCHYNWKFYKKALSIGEGLYVLEKEVFGKDACETSETLNIIMQCAFYEKQYKNSQHYAKILYDMNKDSINPTPELSSALTYMMKSLFYLKQYRESESTAKELYSVNRIVYGQKDPETITAMFYRMLSLYYSSEYRESYAFAAQVYEDRRDVLGERHKDTIRALMWLGTLAYRNDDYMRAKNCFELAESGYRMNNDQDGADRAANWLKSLAEKES